MNNLIKNKITIIIPNRGGNYIHIVTDNLKKIFKNMNIEIIVINQEDKEPFQKGQLYNIAFKFANSEYILLIDNDIYNFQKYNLIETYNKINNPFVGFNELSQLLIKENNETCEIETHQAIDKFNGFNFMKYIDFCNSGGFSNLCFNVGYENNILDYKLHGFKRLNIKLGHIGHTHNSSFKSIKNNKKVLDLYKDKQIEFFKDGYEQTLYKKLYDYVNNNIRYIGVYKIHVPDDYKYLDLYNQYLNEAKKEIENFKKNDIGVSVCITAYKAIHTIKDTLDSVIRQTWFQKYDNWEILLGIDGCEETLKYVKKIMNNYKNLRVFMMDSNQGTYVTSNTLMNIAQYDNLIRFDSDDIMCPNMIETLMENANKYDVQIFRFAYLNNKWKTTHNSFGQHFIKKHIFEKFGGYRDWKCAADYDFILRIYKFCRYKYLKDNYLFYYRVSNNSLTHTDKTGMKSKYRQRLHNFINSQNYENENNAKIECITNDFKEINSNINKYQQDNYMFIMTLDKNWPNIE